MPLDGPGTQQSTTRLGAIAAVAALVVVVSAPVIAGILDPLNPFSNSNVGPVTPEEKARRDQARTELYDRLSPGYAMSVPFVSEAAVASLQQGVERYRQIVAAGGWPAMPGNTSLRAGDTGAEIVAARRQFALSGDLPAGGRASPVFDREFQDALARFQIRNGHGRLRPTHHPARRGPAHLRRAQCLGTGAAEAGRDQSCPRQVDA